VKLVSTFLQSAREIVRRISNPSPRYSKSLVKSGPETAVRRQSWSRLSGAAGVAPSKKWLNCLSAPVAASTCFSSVTRPMASREKTTLRTSAFSGE
jgi:hypothetical protein